jgi:hypothetical protein
MKMSRTLIPSLVAATALLVALVIFRLELVSELGLSLNQALATGLWRGIAYDVFAVLLAFTMGGVVAAVAGSGFTLGFALMGLVAWLSSLASLLHYRFFRIPLDWWIVKNHWGDFAEVQGSARDMAEGQFLPVCIGLYVLAVFSVAAQDVIVDLARWGEGKRRARRPRGDYLKLVLGSALLLVVMWRMPFWLEMGEVNRVIGNHPLRAWLYDATHGQKLFASSGMGWTKGVQLHGEGAEGEPPSVQLARYRDYYQTLKRGEAAGAFGDGAAVAPEGNSLVRTMQPDAETSRALRERLGLPQDEKLNVIIVFLESVRGYELWHPQWGLKLFPRLRGLLDQHASTFDQAYSSSFRAGQTVRGQFSTLCSMLPNTAGAATYIAHTTLRINCIQAFLKSAGYQTAWFNSHYADFHRKRPFEILHGMDQFFDGSYFRGQGITEEIGSWGLADAPVLQEALRKMEALASSGQPLFAHALTISTHHPYTVVPEGRVPEELLAATAGNPKYQGYLSRLRYTDDAVSDFVESFMKSSLADNTVMVMLGDHSTPVLPSAELSDVQHTELRFRIPMAIISKNHREPRRYSHPVHQVDVTPTIASIVGLGGEVAWLGNNLYDAPGSPWLYQVQESLSYRTEGVGCYHSTATDRVHCYDVAGKDPLFAESLEEISEDADTSLFFRETVAALVEGIALNRIMD